MPSTFSKLVQRVVDRLAIITASPSRRAKNKGKRKSVDKGKQKSSAFDEGKQESSSSIIAKDKGESKGEDKGKITGAPFPLPDRGRTPPMPPLPKDPFPASTIGIRRRESKHMKLSSGKDRQSSGSDRQSTGSSTAPLTKTISAARPSAETTGIAL